MASHVQAQSNSSASTATITTPGITTTAGNTVVIVVATGGTFTGTPVSDSKGNSWTQIGSETVLGSNRARRYYSKLTTVGAAHTFSGNFTGATYCAIWIEEITVSHATPLDQQTASTFTTTTTPASGNITTTGTNTILVSAVVTESASASESFTAGSGYTIPANGTISGPTSTFQGAIQYQVLTSPQTKNGTFTITSDAGCLISCDAFKDIQAESIGKVGKVALRPRAFAPGLAR
jgi:hypothetical protein